MTMVGRQVAPQPTHVHSALASARFNLADAAAVYGQWGVFLDSSLGRWEVYVDAGNERTFVHPDLWESLDGPTGLLFRDDFVNAYRDSAVLMLRTLDTSEHSAYVRAARQHSKASGSDQVKSNDRLTDLGQRAQALMVEAAGQGGARSAYQRQVFAVRHAGIVEELTVLEQEMARLRSAVELASRALLSADD